jgi:hypothetical protein
VIRKRYGPSENGGPPTAAEEKEEGILLARIAEMSKTISCPANYGPIEVRNDSSRLHRLWCKRMSPPSCGGGTLNDVEDAEEAQLMARTTAFQYSPQGRARARIQSLQLNKSRSPDEQNEFDRLLALYPDPPDDPNHPMTRWFKAMEASLLKER